MRWALLALLLMASRGEAGCVELGATGLVVPLDGDAEVTREAGWDLLTWTPPGQVPRSMTLRPVDIFGIVGGRVLANGMELAFETTTVPAKGRDPALAVLRGTLMAPLPFKVTCSVPTGMAEAGWCLPLIGKLRLKAEGCATGDE